MRSLHPAVRILAIGCAAVLALIVVADVLLISGDDSSDAATDLATPAAASSDSNGEDATTTSPPAEVASVADIADRFRQAVNARDAEPVAEFAPTATAATLEFLIGGGPYEKVDCYIFDGKDECRVVNGTADFTFGVDVSMTSVTEITYVGGE